MKRLLTLVAFFATVHASAQQVNPVPDYVFANRMSAGRNTVTDTAAYFSIGPRYGATRGMMPPMVVDTASFSANKRNGLLIFSVQKNKFLYWDSVGVKWAEMAGTAGTALTSADTAALLSTRAWRQKGIDSLAAIRIGGSGTTNYVPKFTAAQTLGNSSIFNHANGNVGVNTTVDAGLNLDVAGSFRATKNSIINNINIGLGNNDTITNHAFGFQALNSNTTGRRNGAFGYSALTTNTSGIFNNAFGYNSLLANTSGNNNNAFGYAALTSNTTGTGNTGYGYQVLYSNTTGSENIAIGSNALYYVTTGGSNVAIGDRSMAFQSATSAMTGSFNVGIGRLTLGSLKTGQQNTAIGDAAMYLFANGSTNTAIGSNALVNNTSGSSNVALGFSAGAYETGSNAFYVNNKDQSNTANDKSFSLLYGVFASSAGSLTNQKLRVNGKLEVATVDSTATGINVLYVDTDGTIKKARGPLNIQTGDPTGGTSKPWKLGEVATVSPTSPNRTIRVEIDGTVYYIHAKTTND